MPYQFQTIQSDLRIDSAIRSDDDACIADFVDDVDRESGDVRLVPRVQQGAGVIVEAADHRFVAEEIFALLQADFFGVYRPVVGFCFIIPVVRQVVLMMLIAADM